MFHNCGQQSISKLPLVHSLVLQLLFSSFFKRTLLLLMPWINDSQEQNHKTKSKQYFFINETRLCGSWTSPLILQTNLVYNNQITADFCAKKEGTQEDSAQQAPPVSAPTWDGLFWSLKLSCTLWLELWISFLEVFIQRSPAGDVLEVWIAFGLVLFRSGLYTLFISGLLSSFHEGIKANAAEEGVDKGENSLLGTSPHRCSSVWEKIAMTPWQVYLFGWHELCSGVAMLK